jgi:hypothetical protein
MEERADFAKMFGLSNTEEATVDVIGLKLTTDPADRDGLATTLGEIEDIDVLLEIG